MSPSNNAARKKIRRTLSFLGKDAVYDGVASQEPSTKMTPARVSGPYYDANVDSYRLVVFDGGKRKAVSAKSEEEALRLKAELEHALQTCDRSIGSALEEYLEVKRKQGLKKQGLRTMESKLRYFLPLELALGSLAPEQAKRLYEEETEKTSRYGRPMAVATHHGVLQMAKYFYQWAIERRYVQTNPFAKVKPIGKRSAGKEQLRVDEARHFTQVLVQACEQQELGAIAVLMQLVLGLRSSEVLNRKARDLDDDGLILWIPAGKTENARRRLEVPEVLRPFLVRLAAGKAPDVLLFDTHQGKPHDTTWLWRHVKSYCQRAKVPIVCAHSLRGLHSTLAVGAGCTSGAVAAALGHGSFSMTAKHYVAPGALQQAGVQRVAEALAGAPSGAKEATALLERLRALSPDELSVVMNALEAATERKAS